MDQAKRGEAEGLKNGTVGQGGLACMAGDCRPGGNVGPGGGLSGDGKCCNSVRYNMTEGKSFLNGGSGGTGARDSFNYKFMVGGFGGGGSAGYYKGGGGGGYSGESVSGSEHEGESGIRSYIPSNHGNTWSAETGACNKGDGYITVRFKGLWLA